MYNAFWSSRFTPSVKSPELLRTQHKVLVFRMANRGGEKFHTQSPCNKLLITSSGNFYSEVVVFSISCQNDIKSISCSEVVTLTRSGERYFRAQNLIDRIETKTKGVASSVHDISESTKEWKML